MKRRAAPGQGKQACFQEKFAWRLTHWPRKTRGVFQCARENTKTPKPPKHPRNEQHTSVTERSSAQHGNSAVLSEYHRISQNVRGWKGPLWVI